MPPKKRRKTSHYFVSSEEEGINCKNKLKEGGKKEPCTICLDSITDEASIACVHRFCFACIKSWADVTNLCPLCKVQFSSITKVNNKKNNVVIVEDKVQTFENQEGDEELARRLAEDYNSNEENSLQHGYDSDDGFVVPDDVIDDEEYDDGLPDEEESYREEESYSTEESESLDFIPRRILRRSTLMNTSRNLGRRLSALRENRVRQARNNSQNNLNHQNNLQNNNVIDLMSPTNDNDSNAGKNDNSIVTVDNNIINLISPEQNDNKDEGDNHENGNSGMIFGNFHRRENTMNTPIAIDVNRHHYDVIEEESPYF